MTIVRTLLSWTMRLALLALFAGSWAMLWGLIPGTAAADEVALTGANREALSRAVSLVYGDYGWPFQPVSVASLSKIRQINLNDPADTSILLETPNLRSLDLRGGQGIPGRFHWAHLMPLDSLSSLYAPAMDITSLDPVKQMPQLHTIRLRENPITSLEALRNHDALFALDVSLGVPRRRGLPTENFNLRPILGYEDPGRQLDPSPLMDKTRLRYLYMRGRRQQELDPYLSMTGLWELDLGANELVSIEDIGVLSELKVLDLSHNRINDLSPVLDIPELHRVGILGNPVTEANIAVFKELRQRGVKVH